MNPDELRRTIAEQERQLEQKKAELRRTETTCNHNWTKPVYEPIIEKSYTVPGSRSYYGNGYVPYDEAGYANDYYVPSKTTPAWTRRCLKCGKKETTTNCKETITKTPNF